MTNGLEEQIDEFLKSMNAKINDIETKACDMLPGFSQLGAIANQSSFSSVGTIVDIPPPQEIDWNRFGELIESNPEDAVFDLINYLRGNLARKASTKRLIEKANSQYVDSSFQRVSTQLTAMINQSILQKHNILEAEISNILLEIEDLKDEISHEFDEIRQMIVECKKQKENTKKEDIYQTTFYQGQQRNRYRPNSSFNSSPSQSITKPMIRPRKMASTPMKNFSVTVTNSLTSSLNNSIYNSISNSTSVSSSSTVSNSISETYTKEQNL
ncbi:hypothetical protein TRFO_17968 [Tritrichomonas foetus]|uniref:Uncharacterized protein n=1 Tax=Tritrichomonas foetus TaxID=1144522 RepID=A0A1J4KN05_9EUKA|nr:hypothetical protein TRFO_17968 [Tritrichomonas foetus]|eukprot:OHT12280.1 hypothetical protein TRFO_17968 [Tritrichomonas foetus]